MRQKAPAAERNREPIAALLRDELPSSGLVLEIASGTGEHAVWFARLFPGLIWQPSDGDPEALESIRAWRKHEGLANVREPLEIDAASSPWGIKGADAILCINMVHISPWEATLGLMRGAGALLGPGAPLILYGPYRRAGIPTASSNEAFDASLKSRNPSWGLRWVEEVTGEAASEGLALTRTVQMPANNLTLVFRKPNYP